MELYPHQIEGVNWMLEKSIHRWDKGWIPLWRDGTREDSTIRPYQTKQNWTYPCGGSQINCYSMEMRYTNSLQNSACLCMMESNNERRIRISASTWLFVHTVFWPKMPHWSTDRMEARHPRRSTRDSKPAIQAFQVSDADRGHIHGSWQELCVQWCSRFRFTLYFIGIDRVMYSAILRLFVKSSSFGALRIRILSQSVTLKMSSLRCIRRRHSMLKRFQRRRNDPWNDETSEGTWQFNNV